jgi:lipoyl(octanoyl) transferase
MHISVFKFGRIRFADALAIQQRAVELRRQQRIGDVLLLLEHEPVITLGRHARRENILLSEEQLAQSGIELHQTNRGGDVTYHGPGQLVGYPIIDLRGDFPQRRGPYLGPVDYVRLLEEVLMRTCGEFGVPTQRISGCTGVWTLPGESAPQRKLAAIGVHVSVGITSHGFALNVAKDDLGKVRGFESIIPCGITNRGVTSLQAEMQSSRDMPTLKKVEQSIAQHFGQVFARELLWAESLEPLLLNETVAG